MASPEISLWRYRCRAEVDRLYGKYNPEKLPYVDMLSEKDAKLAQKLGQLQPFIQAG